MLGLMWSQRLSLAFVDVDGIVHTEQEEILTDMKKITMGVESDYMNPFGNDNRENFSIITPPGFT